MKISEHRSQVFVGFALACIMIVQAVAVIRLKPAAFFGMTEDDAIYYSSAKALAQGQGYVLPSIPGSPPATKYPILYSLALSAVWRWNPSFPENINDAAALDIAFGCLFIGGCFAFFRLVGRLGNLASLGLTAFCALHPLILVHEVNILPEIPFAAMVLWALVTSQQAMEPGSYVKPAILCGLISGAAILMRVLGVPVAAGIGIAFLYRREWRKSLVFAASVAPFLVVLVWRSIISAPAHAPKFAGSSQCSQIWEMSWMYHTNYFSFWRAATIQSHAVWGMVRENLTLLSVQPGIYFLDPQVLKPAGPTIIAALLLSVAVWKGLSIHARGRLEPIHFVLVIFLLPVILWDYPVVERFLIPFLPFFVLGMWIESAGVFVAVRRVMTNRGSREQKPAAIFLCLILAIIVFFIGRSFKLDMTAAFEKAKIRSGALREKRAAYSWIVQNTPPESVVMAYEDASLYLYTGRRSFRPVIFSPEGGFHRELEKTELDCITASAKTLGAAYWLISADDFSMEPGELARAARTRERELQNYLPTVFNSDGGSVVVIRLRADSGKRR